ncbi:MAG: hypothetical protein Q9170_000763 [Blastenia crenularia]
MADTHRPCLNYGYFGQPVYDVKSEEWRIARQVTHAPQLQTLSPTQLLLPSPLIDTTSHIHPTVARRDINSKLIRSFPELAPSSGLLSSLVAVSERSQQNTAGYDPAVSDLLAFGRALHPHHHRKDSRTVPVVAFPGGSAGEIVKVVLLVSETVGWDNEGSKTFKDNVFRSRVQGLWSSNGSRIQQLRFAETKGEPTGWLAVRHGKATSILRIVLREREVPTPYRIPRHSAIEQDLEYRIAVEEVVTLTFQRSGGNPHADVCFNPWNPSKLAIIDQASHWCVWNIQRINKKRDIWTLTAGPSGQLENSLADGERWSVDSQPKYDGWGAVRWLSDGAGLVVCNRRSMVFFELRDLVRRFSVPDLRFKNSDDWILDIKQATTSPNHVFLATSTRIFCTRLFSKTFVEEKQPQPDADICLTWTHFRDKRDTTLSMQVIDVETVSIVLLYSRLAELTTVFTFDKLALSSKISLSACDPYVISFANRHSSLTSMYLTPTLTVLPNESHKIRAPLDGYSDRVWYFKCMMLNADLSLEQCYLVSASPALHHPLEAPQSLIRQPTRRSSYRIMDDFIVPNGLLDTEVHDTWSPSNPCIGLVDGLRDEGRGLSSPENRLVVNLEWLAARISSSTLEPMPPDRSLGLQSAYKKTEDAYIQRLRAPSGIASQPPLPTAMMGILSQWSVGQNPDDYEWEISKSRSEGGNELVENAWGEREKRRQRRERWRRRQQGSVAVSSSHSLPSRPAASQGEIPNHPQPGSQPLLATASQPQLGPYGDRKVATRKHKDKKPGFQ